MFGLVVRVVILVGLIKLLLVTPKPFLCAGIYTAIACLFSLMLGASLLGIVLVGPVRFALASLYFWLLARFEDSGGLWWLIAIGGIVVGLV